MYTYDMIYDTLYDINMHNSQYTTLRTEFQKQPVFRQPFFSTIHEQQMHRDHPCCHWLSMPF